MAQLAMYGVAALAVQQARQAALDDPDGVGPRPHHQRDRDGHEDGRVLPRLEHQRDDLVVHLPGEDVGGAIGEVVDRLVAEDTRGQRAQAERERHQHGHEEPRHGRDVIAEPRAPVEAADLAAEASHAPGRYPAGARPKAACPSSRTAAGALGGLEAAGERPGWCGERRTRSAPGRVAKRSGGSSASASPSTPAGIGPSESTTNAGVVHERQPGKRWAAPVLSRARNSAAWAGLSIPTATTPSSPESIRGREPMPKSRSRR